MNFKIFQVFARIFIDLRHGFIFWQWYTNYGTMAMIMPVIEIVGARKHNLKNISLSLPKQKIVTITGVSGSGKSSLAYDTIFQEGQRKYLESLSNYARQFIKSLNKPDVQSIKGISPTISIDQKHSSFFHHSTVGTISEISQYLRLLYAKVAVSHCPQCDQRITPLSQEKIVKYIYQEYDNSLIRLFSPVVRGRKGVYRQLFEKYQKRGFLKARVDGEIHYLDNIPDLNRHNKHDIEILIDALNVTKENQKQIEESVALALFEGAGEIILLSGGGQKLFSNKLYCHRCKLSLKEPQPASFSFNSPLGACEACNGAGIIHETECASCGGSGLNREARSFKFQGRDIYQLGQMEIKDLLHLFQNLQLTADEVKILEPILPQIQQRLASFVKLNLGYISLNRKIHTISGGELQRTRLVSQIGFSLSGIIYILDEPSIGMHVSEQLNLIDILHELKAKDNTVIVVEHDENTIKASDYIVDLGPGSGEHGGEVVYSGYYRQLHEAKNSLTADYLFKRKTIKPNHGGSNKKASAGTFITVNKISINNINDLSLKIPLNALTVVTGVSGSGKSSLVVDAFYPIVYNQLNGREPGTSRFHYSTVNGLDSIDRILMVNQSSIGKNSRSCPATYINLMPLIRQMMAGLDEARLRGYDQSRFSFNVKGGRCEACQGFGYKTLEMSFLPQLEVECPVCEGRRYNSETLLVKYKGLSIADILDLTASEAYQVFGSIPWLAKKIKLLIDVGLGYLKLGQSSVTLSGGESQRIKLCKELSRFSRKSSIYLLDEPTVGLHFDDIQKLLDVFSFFISKGDTIVVIEHNLDIIRAADHIIDLGPGGGRNGGRIMYQGTIDGIMKSRKSKTGAYLKGKWDHALQ